jgi:hypothetical protein
MVSLIDLDALYKRLGVCHQHYEEGRRRARRVENEGLRALIRRMLEPRRAPDSESEHWYQGRSFPRGHLIDRYQRQSFAMQYPRRRIQAFVLGAHDHRPIGQKREPNPVPRKQSDRFQNDFRNRRLAIAVHD